MLVFYTSCRQGFDIARCTVYTHIHSCLQSVSLDQVSTWFSTPMTYARTPHQWLKKQDPLYRASVESDEKSKIPHTPSPLSPPPHTHHHSTPPHPPHTPHTHTPPPLHRSLPPFSLSLLQPPDCFTITSLHVASHVLALSGAQQGCGQNEANRAQNHMGGVQGLIGERPGRNEHVYEGFP